MPTGQKITEFDPHCRLKEDGALANPRHERLAILLAEGFERNDALKAVGEGASLTQGKRRYGRRILTNDVFLSRVKVLADERTELEKDPIWGEPMRMTQQLWRSAILAGDIKTMMEAAKLRMTIAEKRMPDVDPDAPAPSARGPGRPSAESTQTKGLPPDAIKAKLMRVGRKDPELDEDSEVDGEA